MNILKEAYEEVFGEPKKELILEYSGKFKGYNANIRMNITSIKINASKEWKNVSPEIQKGLLQELLIRIKKPKNKRQTLNMDLYHHFIKTLSQIAPKTQTHPILEQSFKRVNEQFFNGLIPQPNLKLGKGTRRLGTYEYATDTITITEKLLEKPHLMDYVMYHEILHKKHQYTSKAGHSRYHTHAFRKEEKKYPNAEQLEKELTQIPKRFRFW